jgi:galactose-1-phosphate uridylyltransferase
MEHKESLKIILQMFNLHEHPHTRLNLLTEDWILVLPHRTKPPWQGKVESLPADDRPTYPQRDVTAEWAAERLRSLSEVHYKEKVNQIV